MVILGRVLKGSASLFASFYASKRFILLKSFLKSNIKNTSFTYLRLITKMIRISLFALLFSFAGCCSRPECDDAASIYILDLYNFSRAEIDSSMVISYDGSSGWTQPIDTMIVDNLTLSAMSYGDTSHFTLYLYHMLVPQRNYRYQLSTGNQYDISTFKFESTRCSQCFPSRGEDVTRLYSVEVNGQEKLVRQGTLYIQR